jgi:drug/metabolite transporter (DMT)-like permease
MLLAVFIFSVANVFVKIVSPHYPIIEIVFFRNVFALLPAMLMVAKGGGWKTLRTTDLPYHACCGALGVLALYCLFTSFQLLPLADATCFAYASILFVAALSGPFLKEYIDLARWVAVLAGFVGVIIMAKPAGDVLNYGVFYSLTFSVIDAFVMLSARKLSRSNKPGTIVFYFVLFAIGVSGIFLPFVWQTPSWRDFVQFAAIGLLGGSGQLCLTQAYKCAPAGTIAPMIYSSMLWSILFGYVIWGDLPTLNLWIGGAIIIASGLYILYRENKASHLSESVQSSFPQNVNTILQDELQRDAEYLQQDTAKSSLSHR